jgi:hypothetical protein
MTEDFIKSLRAEVEKAEDGVVFNGDISYDGLTDEEKAVNEEWVKTIDTAYELIADFAKKYELDGLF